MGSAQIKDELHQFIDRADERVLNLMYGMMKADGDEFIVSESHREILDERLFAHTQNPEAGSSWSDVRTRIKERP